jgi:hypothetical protein
VVLKEVVFGFLSTFTSLLSMPEGSPWPLLGPISQVWILRPELPVLFRVVLLNCDIDIFVSNCEGGGFQVSVGFI